MLPVVSTTVFGRFPDPGQLVHLRRLGLLQVQVDLDQLTDARTSPRLVRAGLNGAGMSVPSAHLPRLDPVSSLDALRRSLDDAAALGAVVAVVHARPDVQVMGSLCDAAGERGLVLAFEIGAAAGATADALSGALSALGFEHGRHGLCLDTSRWRPPLPAVDGLRPRLRWLEVSGRPGHPAHVPPELSDEALYRLVERTGLPRACYELVPSGLPGHVPGDLQLDTLLRAVDTWHRGGGRTSYEHPVVP